MNVHRCSVALACFALIAATACDTPTHPSSEQAEVPGLALSYSGSTDNISESFFQGFETDASGWFGATRVASGTNGIASATGSYHATMAGDGSAFTRFGGYSSTWPGAFIAEIKVYLDPGWSTGEGFDYSTAINNSAGIHLRDFIFHVGKVSDGRLLVTGDNNTYVRQCSPSPCINEFILTTKNPYEVTAAGWYTLQHVFYDDAGVLAVDLNLIDPAGSVVWTTTLSNASDVISDVGGNRYGWFIFSTRADLPGDDSRLGTIVAAPGTKDDCKNGGWESFGFRNQGQCIASVQANEKAGK